MSGVLGTSTPPRATRAGGPGWRDPRLWVGVAIVAVSVVVGARLLGSADDTESVWAVSGRVAVGEAVTADDLVARRVHFADDGDLAHYFLTGESLPDGARLVRPVDDGELLPRSALGDSTGRDDALLPIAVTPSAVPPTVGPGSVVDVYVVAGRSCRDCDEPALAGVTVVEAPAADQLADSRQLVVSVDDDEAQHWFELLAPLDQPTVTVVGRG